MICTDRTKHLGHTAAELASSLSCQWSPIDSAFSAAPTRSKHNQPLRASCHPSFLSCIIFHDTPEGEIGQPVCSIYSYPITRPHHPAAWLSHILTTANIFAKCLPDNFREISYQLCLLCAFAVCKILLEFMATAIEARSLALLTTIASDPPLYPRNPTQLPHAPLTLYIVRVPGSKGRNSFELPSSRC